MSVQAVWVSGRIVWVRYDANNRIAAVGATEQSVTLAAIRQDGAVIHKVERLTQQPPW